MSGIPGEGPPPAPPPAPAASRSARPWWQRLLRLTLVIVLCALLLVSALLFGLQTPPAKRYVLQRVTQWLAENQATRQIDVQVRSLDYRILTMSPTVTLDHVVIRRRTAPASAASPTTAGSTSASESPPFASADRATITLSLSDLLNGRYVIREGALVSPDIHLVIDEQGRTNVPPIESSSEPSSKPIDYLIERFQVSNGRVRYEDRRQDLDLTMPISSIDVKGDPATRHHQIQLAASGGTLRLHQNTLDIAGLDGRARLAPDGVKLERLDLNAAGSQVTLTGGLDRFADPTYDVSLNARLDVAKLASFTGLQEPVGGRVTVQAQAKGPMNAIVARTHVQSDDLAVRGVQPIALDTEASYDAVASLVRVPKLELDLPSPSGSSGSSGVARAGSTGKLHGNGQLALNSKAGNSTLTLTIDALDTAQLSQALRVPYAPASFAHGTAQASWPSMDYEHATGNANIVLTPSRRAAAKGIVPLAGTIAASAKRDAKGDIVSIDLTRVEALGATADGRVTLAHRRDLGGEVRLNAADLANVVSSAEAFLGRKPGSLAPVPVAGPLGVNAALSGTTTRPTVDAAIDTPDPGIDISTLNDVTLHARARYTSYAVSVDNADIAWRNAHARASGSYGLTRRQPITLDVSLDETPIENGLAAAGKQDLPLTGTVAFNTSIHGTVKDPEGKANLRASNVTYEGDALGDVTVDTTIANRQAQIHAAADTLKLAADANIATSAPYHANADIKLDALDLTKPPFQRRLADLSPNTPIEGIITAHVTGEGDLTNPTRGRAAATIDKLALRVNGQPIETDGPATVRYADQRLAIDRLIVTARDSRASLTGDLPLDPNTGEGTINVDAALNLPSLADYAPKDLELQADGTLALKGTVTGTLKRIDPALTLTLDRAAVRAKALPTPLEDIGLRVNIKEGAARIEDVHASLADARLKASGLIPFGWLPEQLPVEVPRQTGEAKLQASVDHLNLATLPGAPKQLTGTVALRADVNAPKPDITTLTGQVTFPQLELAFDKLTLAQQGETTIVLDRGDARVEKFTLDGSAGRIDVAGHAGLIDPRPLDIVARANVNAGALSALTKSVRAAGRATLEVSAKGTAAAPSLNGFAELTNGRVSLESPLVAAQGVNARVDFTPERVTLSKLEGTLNGGALSGSGGIDLEGTTIKNVDLNVKANDVALEAPLGIRSLTDGDIHVTQRADPTGAEEPNIVIGGQVTIQEAGLTDDINLDTGVFEALTAPRSLDLTEERNPLLERTRFDIKVNSASPMIVDNNLARAEIDADLRVLGTPYETGLSGRLTLNEGSELLLNERTYNVQRGIVTFIDDRRIMPSLDIELETTARKYDITIDATGTPGDTTTTLTSTPSLPEPDIMALLVTGRTLDEMRGEEFDVAKTQVLSYLGGRVGSQVGRGLQKSTGLSEVRIEPNLIANETDPSARLTVGQDLTDDLKLVYSTDLVNSSDHIWVAEYDVSRQFTTRAVRQSDDSYRFDFRHDLRFGGTPDPRHAKHPAVHVASVNISGQPAISEAQVRELFRIKPGDKYDFFSTRKGVKRLTAFYGEQGWLQPRIRVQRTPHDDQVDLAVRVNAGPKVTLQFDGYTPSNSQMKKAREIWSRGVFDTQRADDIKDLLQTDFVTDKYVDSKIEYQIDDADKAMKRVTFHVTPGPRFDTIKLAFEGASAIEPKELESVIHEQKLGPKVFTSPGDVTDLLRRLYRERGYLAADVELPRRELDPATRVARVVLPVHEGPQFKIRSVTVDGNRVFDTASLLNQLPSVKGDPYLPSAAEQSLIKLRELYWSKGYNDARPAYALATDANAGIVDVRFHVNEGKRMVVASIDVHGTEDTTQKLVREQMEVTPGTPLDLAALGRSRKNLYGTGAYSMVDITRERPEDAQRPAAPAEQGSAASASAAPTPSAAPTESDAASGAPAPNAQGAPAPIASAAAAVVAEGQAAPAGTAPPSTPNTNDVPVRLNVGVREVQPFQIRYGALFDTERGVGGILDISNHNSLGQARVVGLRSRYDSQLREARLYLSQPSLRAWPVETIASIYYREERNPQTNIADAFNTDRMGVTIQQQKKLHDNYVWTYSYRFERARTYEAGLIGPLPPYEKVSPLTSTLTRETRDDVLDATSGAFLSQAFSFSPAFLGSDVSYIKYFGQYFHYFPLRPPQRERFTNNIIRPRLVYAVGVRLGLADSRGGQVPLSERFLAGGSTTMRGFAQNSLGPIGPDGVPLGGEAMLVINNELRVPLISIFDGVAFLDVGNVFDHIRDFSFGDLRESGGVGLRARTPWFLLRLDYGVPLDRRPGESRSRIFFSIGQAF